MHEWIVYKLSLFLCSVGHRVKTPEHVQSGAALCDVYIRGGLDHKELGGRLTVKQQLKRGVQLVALRPSNLPLSLSLSRHLVSRLLSSLSDVIRRTCALFLCIYLYLTHYLLRNDSQEPKSMDVSIALRSLRHERAFECRELDCTNCVLYRVFQKRTKDEKNKMKCQF